jgi:hypothetical protein
VSADGRLEVFNSDLYCCHGIFYFFPHFYLLNNFKIKQYFKMSYQKREN